MYDNLSGVTPNTAPGPKGVPADQDHLLADLASNDETTRRSAREALVTLGEPTVPGLIPLLAGYEKHATRWEAAKALSEIASPTAVPALVTALEDREFDIRWLAAEGLSRTGPVALAALLQALCERPGSLWLREGAHHVFRSVADPQYAHNLAPVLAAMQGLEPQLTVGPAAQAALTGWPQA